MNVQRFTNQLLSSKALLQRQFHTSTALNKTVAGRYKKTLNRSKPLTYEQAFWPEQIAIKKGWNSHNTGQLEGTFMQKEEIGQDLPHKLLMEDMFIRNFMNGTFPETIMSTVMIKRQHNLIRVACLISRQNIGPSKIYFLLGYAEELMSFWLKCPVKLELQSIESDSDVIFKYV